MYRHMCLLKEMMEGFKCTGEHTVVNGCLTVGTQGNSRDHALYNGVCDCAGC